MNKDNTKSSIIIIALIMALAASLFFLLVKITPLFITAYILALLGIALFCVGNLYLVNNPKSYPWFVSFPVTIWRYLIVQIIVSAVFVIRENLFDSSFSTKWFIVIHAALLAFFVVLLIIQKSGKEIIEKRDDDVKQKVAALRFMQADVEALLRQFPDREKELRQVAEALRYSDPMSHSSLAVYEEQIQRGIMALSEDKDKIPERCTELLKQIADRNARVKLLK